MILHRPCRPSLPYSLLALALASPLAALAQDAATAGSPSAVTLDAVEVTAQRRVENIQDVPVSISIVPAQTLEAITAAAGDVRVLSGRVPSLNIESSFGRAFPRFYIRGLGNTDFDLNASQPVSLVYDDVVQENPILKGFPMFDLERVEVLRGPQGTLYGKNTTAGAINITTNQPTFDYEAKAEITLGNLLHGSIQPDNRTQKNDIDNNRCCNTNRNAEKQQPDNRMEFQNCVEEITEEPGK